MANINTTSDIINNRELKNNRGNNKITVTTEDNRKTQKQHRDLEKQKTYKLMFEDEEDDSKKF